MSDFNPDQYLAEKTAAPFDPDKYLRDKTGDASTEGARNNVFQQGVQTVKNIGAGALKGTGNMVRGVANLFSNKTPEQIQSEKQKEDAAVDSALGAEPNAPIANMVGGILPWAVGGIEKGAVEAPAVIANGLERLPPYLRGLASIGKEGAVNAGIGAVASKGAGGEEKTGAIMGGSLGTGAGFLKAVAPSWLKFIASPNKSQQSSLNPLTTEGAKQALESNAIPMFSLAGGASKKVSELLQKDNAMREGLMDKTGAYINIPNVVNRARQSLQDDIANNMKSGISLEDAAATEKWLQDFQESAKLNPNYNPANGQIPIKDAMRLKTSTGANTNFEAGDVPNAGRGLANRKLYGQLKDRVETRMSNSPDATAFDETNTRMAQLAPLQEALQNKSFGHGLSPWEITADIGGTALGLEGHPLGYLALAYSIGRRLPGTATAMYKSPAVARAIAAQRLNLPPYLAALADSSSR